MILPPGVSTDYFTKAIGAFRAAIGDEWVYTDEQDIALYKDAYSPFWGESEESVVSAAVAPATTEQVQSVVSIANQFKIPIYPISTGKNLGYGGSAPNLSGSVVVDLKRMSRIIEVDEVRGFAVVEPGVSYFDLYRYIQENKLKLWIDCPEPGWGSVIGNALDRGLGWTHSKYRSHFDAHCGMEVVLPNGELVRTGMGALPGADTWQDYPHGYGASVDGLFAQSNFGIVTKMGFRLLPEPEGLRAGVISAPRYDDIIPLVKVLNRLEASGLIDGLPALSSPVLGKIGMGMPDLDVIRMLGADGGPSESSLQAIAKGRDYWTLRVLFYGPEQITSAKWEYTKQQFTNAVPKASFPEEAYYNIPLSLEVAAKLPATTFESERKVNFGLPNLAVFAVKTPPGVDGHMWFSPVIPRTGEAVMKAQHVFSKAMLELDVYFGSSPPLPVCISPGSFMVILPVLLSRSNPAMNKRAREAMSHMVNLAAEYGWGEYRTPPMYQDQIRKLFNFNDNSLLRLTETLKDAIDPNGIMAAGRYGVWPKHLRGDDL